MAALMAAKHDYELKADSHTHLHLDHRHMGVGGDDSWSPSLHRVRAFRRTPRLLRRDVCESSHRVQRSPHSSPAADTSPGTHLQTELLARTEVSVILFISCHTSFQS